MREKKKQNRGFKGRFIRGKARIYQKETAIQPLIVKGLLAVIEILRYKAEKIIKEWLGKQI